MAVKYQSYPKYRNSGKSWLGDIPLDWKSTRINSICKFEKGYGLSKGDLVVGGEYSCILYGELYTSYKDFNVIANVRSRTNSNMGYKSKGDEILIPGSTTTTGIDLANANYLPNKGVLLGGDIIILKPRKNFNKKFVSYFITNVNEREFIRHSKGVTIYHIYASNIKNMPIFLPSLKEQEKIVNFIDHETTKIDTLIKKQQQLIKLLKEKHLAVISHAVTKGLNSKAPMRDSGVQWLGEVPENWEVKLIKYVCKLESGHTPSKSKPSFWIKDDCYIPWVSLNDTKNIDNSDFIYDSSTKISEVGMNNSSAHYIDEGAIVFTRDGARIGLASIMGKSMCVSQHIIAWVPGETVNNHFLLHVIYAMNDELYRISAGATIPTIGMTDIKKMTMCIPTLDEQLEIVKHLLKKRKQYSLLIANSERAIELMKERRTSLISAAVTGKIDVRNWQIPEPSNTNNKEVAA